ncbi:MAG: tetratricopeptide repeat protein [Bacteroidaceae bacterium]|nr:tetratricopeptide repeat protein [Bacteroidaceae bacterium]
MAKNQAPQSLDLNERINKTEAFVNKNKKTIIIVLVAVAALVAAGFAGYTWLKNREAKAQAQLGLGIQYIAQQTPEGFTKALNGEGQFLGFLKIAKKYSFTDGANLAHAYAGECYANLGKYKEAIKELESFSAQGDITVSPAVLACLANCYANDKQFDKAIDTFKKAADKADNESLSPVYLMSAAQLLESQNKADEAKAIYEQIKKDYPLSSVSMPRQQGEEVFAAPEIDKYIERATK